VITDGQGVPLAATLTAANAHDITQIIPLVIDVPSIAGRVGHPRSRPRRLVADKGYDCQATRQLLRWLGIQPQIAHRRTDEDRGLGRFRWVVERTLSWLHQFRRLRTRYDRRADLHEAFLELGQSLICWKYLKRFC